MKNTLEELTIADLKALRDYLLESHGKHNSIRRDETLEYQMYEIIKELNKRVENIFGKPLEGQG